MGATSDCRVPAWGNGLTVTTPEMQKVRSDSDVAAGWFLSAGERDNPYTVIDKHADPGTAWSTGNLVRPLLHGKAYFRELVAAVRQLGRGDLLLFTDWRGDADERLDGPGTEVGRVFAEAARRGTIVKCLMWRSHSTLFQFSQPQNRRFAEELSEAGAESLLDTRIRAGGCHHQKFVVLRHPGRPELDIAFLGGIDLCHGRNDDHDHAGDAQPVPMAPDYGSHPPWHDVQVAIQGPAVGAIEAVFRERWDDPTPSTRNPLRMLRDSADHLPIDGHEPPPQLPDPEPVGRHAVQLLRTYPHRRKGFPFAPRGERSVARGYAKAINRARQLIYLEDQYLWSPEVAQVFADALRARPELRVVAVVPRFPDQASPLTRIPQLLGRARALDAMRLAGSDRVSVYSPENVAGTPVYVHAKVCIIDDTWAAVGSDNLNLRSWTYDTELSCAVIDEAGTYASNLRRELNREHVDRDLELPEVFDAFAESAAALDRWYAEGCVGPRPPGRLRRYDPPRLSWLTQIWASPLYRLICDPDGRPSTLRRRQRF
jgi:phosphatidylserine/phosphatidylglycerophosphate/cardiolipin synthase-like enzyme